VSIFAGIEHKAGADGRSPDITPGDYVFEGLFVADGLTTQSQTEFFKVGVRVVESSGLPHPAKDGTLLPPLAPGAETEIFIQKDKYKYYITDIKNVVAAISTSLLQEDVKPADVTEEGIRELIETQGVKGVRFKGRFTAKPGVFRKTGMPVAMMRFEGVLGAAAKAA
jgi:hypothetical protein